jgi:hypothetical protein
MVLTTSHSIFNLQSSRDGYAILYDYVRTLLSLIKVSNRTFFQKIVILVNRAKVVVDADAGLHCPATMIKWRQ